MKVSAALLSAESPFWLCIRDNSAILRLRGEMSFSRDNHYVPRLYLKRFAAGHHRVFKYCILVADGRVPLWKPSSIRGVAVRS